MRWVKSGWLSVSYIWHIFCDIDMVSEVGCKTPSCPGIVNFSSSTKHVVFLTQDCKTIASFSNHLWLEAFVMIWLDAWQIDYDPHFCEKTIAFVDWCNGYLAYSQASLKHPVISSLCHGKSIFCCILLSCPGPTHPWSCSKVSAWPNMQSVSVLRAFSVDLAKRQSSTNATANWHAVLWETRRVVRFIFDKKILQRPEL